MASIRIHQDIHNFEKKRNMFTTKQWTAIFCAAAAGIAMAALNIYALRLPPEFGVVAGIVVMAPFVVVGFVPIQGMPSERFIEKRSEMNERGDALVCKAPAKPHVESELTSEYQKKARKRGFEGTEHGEIVQAAAQVEKGNEGLPDRRNDYLLQGLRA